MLSFGGPAGQIALMHRELVEQRRWISETRFLHALNYCMLLPGPEAQQLAIYIGWLLHRTWGGVVAGLLFVLPGACVLLVLSLLYASFHELPLVTALFFGVKAAVLAIVLEAVVRVARRALKSRFQFCVAAAAFVALFFLALPFPLIISVAGLLGACVSRFAPKLLPSTKTSAAAQAAEAGVIDAMFTNNEVAHTRPSLGGALRVLLVWLPLWVAPVALAALLMGRQSIFVQQGLFFSQAAVVTFGGAYSVLSYVAQRAVTQLAWLSPGEMLDGLALAETTPGPLILVLQFVAFLGASRAATGLTPVVAGLLGSLIMLWVTFVPCFLWIFLGAPWIESLRNLRWLNAALATVTAAVVGVIFNLALWFGLHVLFGRQAQWRWHAIQLHIPDLATTDWAAVGLTALAILALFRLKLGVPLTLAACALLGILLKL